MVSIRPAAAVAQVIAVGAALSAVLILSTDAGAPRGSVESTFFFIVGSSAALTIFPVAAAFGHIAPSERPTWVRWLGCVVLVPVAAVLSLWGRPVIAVAAVAYLAWQAARLVGALLRRLRPGGGVPGDEGPT